jgi:hypothetical protein
VKSLLRLLCTLALVGLAACDDSFSPIQPSEIRFSIFGYLDASADTQWIRVMPLRSTTLTSPGPLGATVTIEQLGSDRVVELRDSVFRFQPGNDVGSEGVYLHNYWTTERIEPDATYRFSASMGGGRSSEAVVEIPPDFQVEVLLAQDGSTPGDSLRVIGLHHVAFGQITYYYDSCGNAVESSLLDTRSSESEIPLIPISRRRRFRGGCGPAQVRKQELLVIGSGAPWPDGPEFSVSSLGVSDSPSNVSNSVGFLGGVLTKRIPYEHCLIVGFVPSREHCRLRYDEASATLRGTVRSVCRGEVIADADVRLREINPEPPAAPKERFTSTNRSGEFEIGALEVGRRYAMHVGRLGPYGLDEFVVHTDTLGFAAGENATYDVVLRPLAPCET